MNVSTRFVIVAAALLLAQWLNVHALRDITSEKQGESSSTNA
jgi:hypothetical protein